MAIRWSAPAKNTPPNLHSSPLKRAIFPHAVRCRAGLPIVQGVKLRDCLLAIDDTSEHGGRWRGKGELLAPALAIDHRAEIMARDKMMVYRFREIETVMKPDARA